MPAVAIRELVEGRARAAREAGRTLAVATTRAKNEALGLMARGVEEEMVTILEANRVDVERARDQGHSRAFLDRLTLTERRIADVALGI
ncbi:MAG: gamma-glutamyl-phosphate reductase, partial [Candidatus Rokuibacteriota bacterium]